MPPDAPSRAPDGLGRTGQGSGRGPALEPMEIKFDPIEGKAFERLTTPAEKRQFLNDYAKQLRGQEAGINKMSVDEYLDARQQFKDNKGRNPLAKAAQEQFSANFEAGVADRIFQKQLRKIDINAADAQEKVAAAMTNATERAAAIKSRLNALHEPDNVAGGYPHFMPTKMGNASVNQSIGGSWNGGKLADMDRWAQGARQNGLGSSLMNISFKIDTKWNN